MPSNSNAAPLPDPNTPQPPELHVVPSPPAAAAPEVAAKKHPGKLNKRQLTEIEQLDLLIPICREAGAVAPLAARNVNAAFLAAAEGRIALARTISTTAVTCTVLAKVATQGAGEAKDELMKSLRTFQNAARVEYQETDPTQLDRYLVGERIDQSRPILEQSGQTIISSTNTDRPPSIDTEMIVQATVKLAAYANSPVPQADERAAAKAARATRDQLVREIIDDRQKIQTAADSAWPYTTPANAGMRLKFRLPANRPYVA